MDEQDLLAERFEERRGHLRGVAYRMLGSLSDADDAVQETWFRLHRADTGDVANLTGWLTTVIARICLDMLRSRAARPDRTAGSDLPETASDDGRADPEQEAVLAESVGRALLVVLGRLSPAERIAFVLHDMFAVPFEQIAPVVGRTPVSAKKLASRARHRVRGTASGSEVDLSWHRRVVEAFLDASRGRDINGLLAVLDPDVVRHADAVVLRPGAPTELRGVDAVVGEALVLSERARFAEVALVDGAVGVVVAPAGRLLLVLTVTIRDGRITAYEVIGDPARLDALELTVPED